MAKLSVAFLVAAAFLVALVSAGDPGPINDFCVADLKSTLLFNGLTCKSPAMVTSADFTFTAFRADADTNTPFGIGLIPGFAGVNYPALNTQGLSLAKINYAKWGLVSPHTHPRAAELITVVKGSVYVGFVDTAGKLYAAWLKVGDFFLFPQGLVHFILNGDNPSATLSILNAQNPGIQLVAPALFGSSPAIESPLLAKAFGVSVATVDAIKKVFQPVP